MNVKLLEYENSAAVLNTKLQRKNQDIANIRNRLDCVLDQNDVLETKIDKLNVENKSVIDSLKERTKQLEAEKTKSSYWQNLCNLAHESIEDLEDQLKSKHSKAEMADDLYEIGKKLEQEIEALKDEQKVLKSENTDMKKDILNERAKRYYAENKEIINTKTKLKRLIEKNKKEKEKTSK